MAMPEPRIVTVPVKLPDWIWGRLATIAEHRKVLVSDLIADGILHTLENDPSRLAELQMELKKRNTNSWKDTVTPREHEISDHPYTPDHAIGDES